MSEPVPPTPEETIRRAHLSHEASIISIGTLYYLGAIMLVFTGLMSVLKLGSPELGGPWAGLFFIALGVAYFQLGRWFRALLPKAKIPGTILAAIGLLAFPFGTLINIYILYLINSKKGAMVFSDQYRAVIAATPGIKYKTSIVVWVLVGLLLVFFLVALFGALALRKT